MAKPKVELARIYDEVGSHQRSRVLVDRVWPRGVRKDAASLDDWVTDAAPSTELRRWFGHDPDKFPEFRQRYRAELDTDKGRAALAKLRGMAEDKPLTLLTATKDVRYSHASVLAELLRSDS